MPTAARAATARTTMVSGCGGDSACTKYGGLPPVCVGTASVAGETVAIAGIETVIGLRKRRPDRL